ncbi:MAG: peptidyl-prolyl cis-trans isomerase [Deltaproteobacteria bacterium]|nr:peptidyl-prolyl cis-trans isomerase [Deltaproteobacteria bacterium]
MQRLLREPLLHFLVLGGLVFVLYGAMSEPAPAPVNIITIGPERIAQLAKSYEAVWRHPPSARKLEGIIDNEIRDEVYYREAMALGLDTNDTIVRRRLRQKMEFFTDSSAGLLEPVAGELEAYLLANEATFRSRTRLAFEQIYLGPDPSAESIERLLADLQGAAPGEPRVLGVRSMLPAAMDLSTQQAIDAVFGEDFFGQLEKLPREGWSGPVESTFGMHLVRVDDSEVARTPALEGIRDVVLRDWKATKTREVRELHYAKLRKNYAVEIHRGETEPVETR